MPGFLLRRLGQALVTILGVVPLGKHLAGSPDNFPTHLVHEASSDHVDTPRTREPVPLEDVTLRTDDVPTIRNLKKLGAWANKLFHQVNDSLEVVFFTDW